MERGYKLYNITELNPGDHLCVLYETDEEHKALITPYLRSGLENNEKVFYIVDARTSETVLDYLRDDGVNVDPYLESGQLAILTVSESYMKGGVFDPDGMIKMLTEETDEALEEGYSALRVTGEMSWALRGLPGSERLIEYETKLNEFFPNNKALAICQYDCRVFDPEILLDILTTHPIAVLGTEIYENFYYIPTTEFLAGKAPEITLEHWTENLKLRKKMEEELADTEKKYHDLFDHMSSGVAVYEAVNNGKDFIFKDFNPAAENIEHVQKENIIGKSVTEAFPGVKDFGIFEVFQRVWKTGKREYFPENIYQDEKDTGTWRENWVYKMPTGEIVTIYNDISDRKKVELALQESEEKFREVFNNANDAIFLHKIENGMPGKFLEFNDVAYNVLGYSKEELLNMRPQDIDSPETIAKIPLIMESIQKDGKATFESVQIAKDGKLLNVEINTHLFRFRGEDYILSISRDISERKNVEQALKKSERKYRNIFENIQDIFYQTNNEGRIVEISPSIERYSGFTREELIGKPVEMVYFNPEDRKNLLNIIHERGEAIDYKLKLKTKDKSLIYVSVNAHILFDSNNQPIGIEGSLRDITEREKAEKALMGSEERYSITLDAVNDGLWDWDVSTGDAFFSPNYYKLLGYDPGEFPANYASWRLLVHSDDVNPVEKELQKSVKSGKGFEIDLRMKSKSGEWLWVSIRGKAVQKDSTGTATRMVGTLSDITERVNAQKEMKLHQIRLKASLDLFKMADDSIKEIIDFVLEVSLKITESKYAFIGLMSEDELVMTIHAWSKGAMDECSVSESPIHFPIPDAGIWGECVRQRKPVKVNNYESSNLYKKGYPDGHVPIKRFIGVPVFDEGRIVVVAAAANKEEKYNSNDIKTFNSLLNDMWRLIQRKNDEKKIKKALEEKEMLLKEIHHRVKNNLMIISSLLNLQSRYIKDKISKDIFKESQNRARSMALIHERLYQATDLKRIDFGDYIQTLSNELFRTYAGDFGLIELKINVEDIFLDINTAIPLGLIVNELITNSIKHAFPEGMKGEINVDFHPKDDHYEFTVKDNGIGFPYDLDFHKTDSLGMQMVTSLTDQIDGEIELNRSHGTEFKITFKDLK